MKGKINFHNISDGKIQGITVIIEYNLLSVIQVTNEKNEILFWEMTF